MTVLLGRTTAGTTGDFNAAGHTAAWKFVAAASGQLKYIFSQTKVSNPTGTGVKLGVYADSAGVPGTRLGFALVDDLTAARGTGVFRATLATPVSIVSGTTYHLSRYMATEQCEFQGDASAATYQETTAATDTLDPMGAVAAGGVTSIIWGEDEPSGGGVPFRVVPFMLRRFSPLWTPGRIGFPLPSNGVSGPLVFPQALDANVTSAATMTRQVGKIATANATVTATIVKSVGKPLAAAATVTATVLKAVGKPLTATVTSTATMSRQVGKTLTATVTTAATVVKRVNKTLLANATVSATLVATRAFLLTLSATVTTTATMVRQVGKRLTANATTTATVTRSVAHAMTATATTTATITKQVAKTLTATVTSIATLIATFVAGGAITIYTRFFGAPSPDEAELGGAPDANLFGGSPGSDDFGPGSPGSGGFGPPGPGRS